MSQTLSRAFVRAFRGALCLGLLALVGRAQTTRQIVPAGMEAIDGASVDPFVLGGFEGRVQVLIGRSQLGSLATKAIRRIILRRDAQTNASLPAGMKGGWIDLVIRASWSPRDPRNPSASFAANHGAGPVVVYRGGYHVIDSPPLPRGAKVASLAANVSAHIVLATPILPARSGNLCLDFVYRRHATKAPPEIWVVDAVEVGFPPTRSSGRSCWRKGDPQSAAILSSAAVGASMICTTRGPAVPVALLVIGASDTHWGPVRLPLDLTALGAAGCLLYVSQDLVRMGRLQGSPGFPFAHGNESLEIPLDARLVGARIHSQWFFYQPRANALGVTMTNAASVVLPAGPSKLGVGMLRGLDPNAATGHVFVHRAPVLVLADR